MTRGIGQQAHLFCPIQLPNPKSPIQWTRADGKEMPVEAKVDRGILSIPSVHRGDAGLYTCSTPDSVATAEVHLKVTSFVPNFDGASWIELPPVTDNQFGNLQLDVNFKPKSNEGLILYTDKVNPSRFETNFHAGGVKDGKFVYTYDIGHGVEAIESPNRVRLNDWNQIQITNTDREASLKLNDGGIVSKTHAKPRILPYEAVSLDIGGSSGIQQKYLTRISSNYKGVISSVLVDGEPLDLSTGKRIGEVSLYDACQAEPCLNGGHCIPANVGQGYICQCDIRFTGDFCERRSAACGDNDCNGGMCVENEETGLLGCICPIGSTGQYCDETITEVPKVISFAGDNAFLALPAPTQVENFTVSMRVIPPREPKNESMLLFLASSYAVDAEGFLNIGIVDDKIQLIYKNRAGKSTISSIAALHPEVENVIEVQRVEDKTTLSVNGVHSRTVSSTSFRPGTDLFVGGLAPGIPKHQQAAVEPYEGCISELVINGRRVDFAAPEGYSSGDLQQCGTGSEIGADRENLEESNDNEERATVSPPELEPWEPEPTPLPTSATTTTTTRIRPTTTKIPERPTPTAPKVEVTTTEEVVHTVYIRPDVEPSEDPNWEFPDWQAPEEATVAPTPLLDVEEEEQTNYGNANADLEPEVVETGADGREIVPEPAEITTSTTTIAPRVLPTDKAKSTEYSASAEYYETTQEPEHAPHLHDSRSDRNQEPEIEIEDLPAVNPRPREPESEEEEEENTPYSIGRDSEIQELPAQRPTPPAVELGPAERDELGTTIIVPQVMTSSQEPAEEIAPEVWSEKTVHPDAEPEELEPTEAAQPDTPEWSTQLPVPDLNDNSGELSGEEVTVASLPPTPPPTTTTPRPPVVVHPDPYVTPCPGGRCRWPDLCANHRCGVNGVCRQLNESHFECECKIYYDGPNCDIFKPIEHAARFNGDAFIEMAGDDFPHLSSELEETIEFKFKTSRMNGVIFWQGQNPDQSLVGEDYVSIGIRDGFLVFAYELGGGAAEMVSIFRVDDGLMHNVLAIRKGRDGALFVDEFPPVNGSSSGILAMLNVDGNVYIGGVPDLKFMTGGLHRANFDGCVADVTLNGDKMDLMGSAVDGRNVRPCDEWVAPKRFLHRHRRDADWPPLTKTEADQIDAALDLRIRSRHRWGRKEKFFF